MQYLLHQISLLDLSQCFFVHLILLLSQEVQTLALLF
jgi:hypothetical protein